jgi:hypothetical protein
MKEIEMASEKEKKRMVEIDRENEIEVEVGKARLFNSNKAPIAVRF